MKLQIMPISDKIGDTIPFPYYATAGAAALDLHACIDEPVTIPPGGQAVIPAGIAVAIPEGYVGIQMVQDGTEIVVTVEDSGPGIPEEAQKHIFDKFYQTDGSHKDEGNGLGLALVRQILALCGGRIAVENRREGGCRFTVRIPAE